MDSFINYIIEVTCVFSIQYLVYYLLFRRLTFHGTNRIMLMLMLPLSLIIPVLNFGFNPTVAGDILIPRFNEMVMLNQPELGFEKDLLPAMNIVSVIMMIYSIGVIIFAIKLVSNALKLILIKQKSSFHIDNEVLIISADVSMVFSCFHWIFVPKSQANNCEETILQHEKLHAKLWHTVDLILTEIFIAFFWFNPFVYFFRKSIKSLHEFQVDSMILNSDYDKVSYLRLILQNLDFKYRKIGLYNYFNGLTIKNRVNMITNNKSSKIQLIRYFLIIPVIAFLILSFTNKTGEKPELFPIKNGEYTNITSQHGQTFNNPFTKKETIHNGIDIKADEGVNVLATAGGTIMKISEENGWGKLIVIDHGNGTESWYAHLKDFNVKYGEAIKEGQIIGFVGSTGYATAPHLHFEIRMNGTSVDPFIYVKK